MTDEPVEPSTESTLARVIRERGLTDEEVGRLAGCRSQQVNRIKHGRRVASPELAIALERALRGAVGRGDLRPDLWPPNLSRDDRPARTFVVGEGWPPLADGLAEPCAWAALSTLIDIAAASGDEAVKDAVWVAARAVWPLIASRTARRPANYG